MKHWNKLSLLIAVAAIGWIWRSDALAQISAADLRTIAGTLASIAATMLGFLFAALAILASIAGHRLVRNMQRTGHYAVLLKRFFWNTAAYFAAMAIACVTLLMPECPLRISFNFVAFSFGLATLMLIDIGWRFWLVLSSLTPD